MLPLAGLSCLDLDPGWRAAIATSSGGAQIDT